VSPTEQGTAARRPRNPRGEGGRLRSEIVAAAHDLLDEAGEDAVTLRAIARRVGISAPSIYRHFDDRQAILLAVAEDAFSELARALRDAADAHEDPAARPRAVCEAYLGFARDRPSRYLIMFGGVWDGGRAVESGAVDAAEVTTLGTAALATIAAALRGADSAPAATTADPLTAATVLWVGLHGLAHQRLVAPGFPWPPDTEERLITALTGPRTC
jgi:AcrR family transcriptional regulator